MWLKFLFSRIFFILFFFFPALDTTNIQVKKQVFELLSALCVYSAEGYSRALEALEHYQTFRSERYRFKLVVDELRDAKSAEYKTILLAFINCLIISTPQLKVLLLYYIDFIHFLKLLFANRKILLLFILLWRIGL